jgi:SET domain-containing protein
MPLRIEPGCSATEFEVLPSAGKGLGLFACRPFARGERVLALEGRLLSTQELSDDLLALQVGENLWLCSEGSHLDDFINHSCEANTGFLDGQPVLQALRDIAAGEEICWDYSTSISEAGWSLECRCGSSGCRGVIRPWPELSSDVRNQLRPHVLQYLQSK